jgi:hypothetical protein
VPALANRQFGAPNGSRERREGGASHLRGLPLGLPKKTQQHGQDHGYEHQLVSL